MYTQRSISIHFNKTKTGDPALTGPDVPCCRCFFCPWALTVRRGAKRAEPENPWHLDGSSVWSSEALHHPPITVFPIPPLEVQGKRAEPFSRIPPLKVQGPLRRCSMSKCSFLLIILPSGSVDSVPAIPERPVGRLCLSIVLDSITRIEWIHRIEERKAGERLYATSSSSVVAFVNRLTIGSNKKLKTSHARMNAQSFKKWIFVSFLPEKCLKCFPRSQFSTLSLRVRSPRRGPVSCWFGSSFY